MFTHPRFTRRCDGKRFMHEKSCMRREEPSMLAYHPFDVMPILGLVGQWQVIFLLSPLLLLIRSKRALIQHAQFPSFWLSEVGLIVNPCVRNAENTPWVIYIQTCILRVSSAQIPKLKTEANPRSTSPKRPRRFGQLHSSSLYGLRPDGNKRPI